MGAAAAIALASACGQLKPTSETEPSATSTVYAITLVAPTTNALPKCASSNAGTTAYVQSPVGLFTCQAGVWLPIPCAAILGGAVAYASASQTLLACVSGQWTQVPLPQGPSGPQGPQGDAGLTSLVVDVPLAPGSICANGGTEIDSGVDKDGDGRLTGAEVTSRSYVCTGATGPQGDAGPDGRTTLVMSTKEPAGGNCENGGVKLSFGFDDDGDGKLDNGEATTTSFVCDGGGATEPGPLVGGVGLVTTGGACTTDSDCPANYFCNAGACDLKAVKISVGESRTCALLFNGTVQCWSGTGQPTGVKGISGVTDIAVGGTQTCAVLSDGTVECGRSISTFKPVAGLTDVTAVAGGNAHSCALKSDGSVWCWGENTSGQLGLGAVGTFVSTQGTAQVPMTAPTMSATPLRALPGGAIAIASGAGSLYSCALMVGGTVVCWGKLMVPIVATGRVVPTLKIVKPTTVPDLVAVTAISVGGSDICALVGGKFPECSTGVMTPTVIEGVGFVGAVTAGGTVVGVAKTDFQCALELGGSVSCVGDDAVGELGSPTGTTSSTSSTPLVVPGLANVAAIASGDRTSCAILSDGAVSCWGGSLTGPKEVSPWAMGTACAQDSDCPSSACLGGFCCATACDTSDATCGATACDAAGACIYPDATASCGSASCSGSTLTAGACDGAGACAVSTAACDGQLACDPNDATACLSTCAADTDCAAGNVCDTTSGTCGPS